MKTLMGGVSHIPHQIGEKFLEAINIWRSLFLGMIFKVMWA